MADRTGSLAALSTLRGLKTGDTLASRPAATTFEDELFGRLTEICAPTASAALTATLGLVQQMQERGEPAVWITPIGSAFFPPDAAARGVQLETLVILRVPEEALLTAADKAARSGAFGLIVADFSEVSSRAPRTARTTRTAESARPYRTHRPTRGAPKDAALARLLGLAQKHDAAVLFLTRKDAPLALGSLISLRAEAERAPVRGPASRREVTLQITKDKRRPPGRRFQKQCNGPAGLC